MENEITMDSLEMTSRWVAAARECETLRSDRIFEDPLAGALAGDQGRAMMKAMETDVNLPEGNIQGTNSNTYLTIRTKFMDDWLVNAVSQGIRQVVILAAGMDARAFRLPWPKGTRIFEVDRFEVLEYKNRVLKQQKALPNAQRYVVPIDLQDDFASALKKKGFSSSEPAAFLIEGLSVYLPNEEAMLRILREVAGLAASGSGVMMDIAGLSLLRSSTTKSLRDRLNAIGAPWRYGTDNPRELLAQAGYAEVKIVEPAEVGYGREPYPLVQGSAQDIPRSYFVCAKQP